ncbi:MAG: GDP-mannose 4,6-dehydratase [Nitrospirae bacterium]|nr:GDP-mannose 4,6-dehydratase [Nitrospirota bacterium]
MRVLITGVAGFIGSHLAEDALHSGDEVIGVDCFTPFYDRSYKERNAAVLSGRKGFTFLQQDLSEADLGPVLESVETVFHLSAQAGVRSSWGAQFSDYTRHNVTVTQRLLEASKGRGLRKFVYASSSSVYGEPGVYPLVEDMACRPISPYGVTKLAAEHLCMLYHRSYGVPCVALRYFTVYGPRQRPDMAFHRMIRAALDGKPFPLYGDGRQTRDFTFVADAVKATRAAADAPAGEVLNVGGGSRVTMLDVVETLRSIADRPLRIQEEEPQKGDVRHTWADLTRARRHLNYTPSVGLKDGLQAEWAWLKSVPR